MAVRKVVSFYPQTEVEVIPSSPSRVGSSNCLFFPNTWKEQDRCTGGEWAERGGEGRGGGCRGQSFGEWAGAEDIVGGKVEKLDNDGVEDVFGRPFFWHLGGFEECWRWQVGSRGEGEQLQEEKEKEILLKQDKGGRGRWWQWWRVYSSKGEILILHAECSSKSNLFVREKFT